MNEPQYAPGNLLAAWFTGDWCSLHLPEDSRTILQPAALIRTLLKQPCFDSLASHAKRAAAALQLADNSVPALMDELRTLVELGVLVSRDRLLGPPGTAVGGSGGRLQTLAVPTRDRAEAVGRCVTSFARVASREGRPLLVAVADSASDPARTERTRAALGLLKQGDQLSVRLVGAREKQAFATDLARVADVPVDLVRFAVEDTHQMGGSDTGTNRNALLLGLTGSPLLMADDDTVAEIRSRPPVGGGLIISGAADPSEMWLFRDAAAAERETDAACTSSFSACERLLGRKVAALCASQGGEAVRIEHLHRELAARLQGADASVGVVATGIWGDSGIRFPSFYLWSRPELRRQLSDPGSYQQLAYSRQMIRQVGSPTLSAGSFLMSTCLGLDNDRLLPPFVPVGRGQDLFFGFMLRHCFDDLWIGHLPVSITHRPTDGRGQRVSQLWDTAGQLELATVLEACLSLALPGLPTATSGGARLRLLGTHMQELAAQPWVELDRLLRRELWEQLMRRLTSWDRLLADTVDRDGPWRQDLRRYQETLLQQALRAGPALPDLLLVHRDRETAARTFRAFLNDLGRLLSSWPQLVEAARQLRAKGRGLFGPDSEMAA